MKKIFNLFVIMMMTITASAADEYFTVNDDWSIDYSSKTASCTKDGITFSMTGNNNPIYIIGGSFNFGLEEGTATISVDAGTFTVTGIHTIGTNSAFGEFDLTGTGPWTCPVEFGQIKKDEFGSLIQVKGFIVHVDISTGVESVKSTTAKKAGKFLKGDKVVIEQEGELYNATGQKM